MYDNEVETLDTFPEEWKQEFEGLLYLGHLEKTVSSIPFHTFVVRTLTVNDKLSVSLLTKEFQDTIGYGRAYRAAVVAAGLQSVDGRSLVPGNKGVNVLRQKYDYVINGWYDAVVDTLFAEIDALEGQVIEVLRQIGMISDNSPVAIFEDDEKSNDTPKDGK
jgi:hypothetical protein